MKNSIYPWQIAHAAALLSLRARLPHALLIYGPAGTGKLALAEHLAQGLLCEATGAVPCGACDGCRWFVAGSHPDFRRVEPEALARVPGASGEGDEPEAPARAAKPSTEIKVEQIRALDGFLNLRSHRGGRRIALLHPAEEMNENAANALLKSLEEPPGSAVFLLVSHRPARLLPTVRSRCRAYPVSVPDAEAAKRWLASQGVEAGERWLAYASGSPLRALELAQEAGQAVSRTRTALENRDMEALRAVNDRETVQALAEALQRYALDRAFASMGIPPKFGSAEPSRRASDWLRFARQMGRSRALARHPLNPRLLGEEMLSGMPED